MYIVCVVECAMMMRCDVRGVECLLCISHRMTRAMMTIDVMTTHDLVPLRSNAMNEREYETMTIRIVMTMTMVMAKVG